MRNLLRKGKRYRVTSKRLIPVMPICIDEFDSYVQDGNPAPQRMFRTNDPELRVLEARRVPGGEAWYHVELLDGRIGWINGLALCRASIARISRREKQCQASKATTAS